MDSARVTIPTLIIFLAAALSVSAQGGRYTVQIKAAQTQAAAEELVSRLKARGVEAYWIKSAVPGKGVLYRVRAGRFPTKAAARAYGQRLRQKGIIEEFFAADYEPPPPPAAGGVKGQTSSIAAKPAPAEQPKGTLAETSKASKPVATTNPPAASPGYFRYLDEATGYSFEYPSYWTGSAMGSKEAQAQRSDAGATFKSTRDAAFVNSIWNALSGANSPTHDNDLIVGLIIKSMGSGAETQNLSETSRRVVTEGHQIKTFLELRALFRDPRAAAPLDFLGRAIVIRSGKGILLVAVFYAKSGPPQTANIADHIIRSARAPE
jgi:hypothetical protein